MSQVSPISSPSSVPAQVARQPAESQPAQPQPAQPPPAQTAQPAHQPQMPTTTLVSTLFPNATLSPAEPKTRREKLDAGDAKWQWKIGMRAILILTSIIGIGCAAWATSKYGPNKNPYRYEFDDAWSIPWTLITFTLSAVWCFICVAVFFLRSPNAPVHPGAQVGVDLVLWLAYIPTGLFAVLAVMSVASIGTDGGISSYGYYSSSGGRYSYVPSNNTWVWNSTTSSSSTYYSSTTYTRDCNSTRSSSSYSYSYGYTFSDCAEEDAYVNTLWQTKGMRFNVELTVVVLQFLNLLLHFILFVWACVDTNRRNSRKSGSDAEKIAADIVMKMVQSGAIIPAPGQAHMRPMYPGQMPGQVPGQMPGQMPGQIPGQMPGQYPPQSMHLFPQQFPQQNVQPYPQQYTPHLPPQPQPTNATQPTVASGSNEKSAGSRFL